MCDAFGPSLLARPFQRYHVWKSRSFTYIFGIDKVLCEYSLLRISRKEDPSAGLELLDGEERFPLQNLEAHQRELASDGGMKKVATASGLIGFIRFLQGPYLMIITKHKKVGKIGHHYVLSIEATMLLELFAEGMRTARDEKAFVDLFYTINLSKDFYFSYSYELSRTAQQNLIDAMRAASGERSRPLLMERDPSRHHRFVWNYHHMQPFFEKAGWQHWCLSIIHGFFAYTKCSSFGWTFEIALIARRSRFHAGTRYRKRGLNVDGHVANDVETEQLLCDDSTRHLSRGHIMSFVQVRGSVPLFWSQEATTLNPKPPVIYPRCDPTLSATRLHFADLLERYGTPMLVVNLMKAKKVDSYEVRLSKHFESAIERLNRELPPPVRILYRPFDMKNHAKSGPIYEVFTRLADSVVSRVGFFHTCSGLYGKPERMQSGVVRTNCMDCLDRTNVLQFFVGLEVLQQQLTALNLLPEPRLDFDSQVVFVLQELYDLMGDHLALQYAGSVAHKKNPLLGSRPRMMTSTKELLTSIHRHYNNSYRDNEKQAGMNFFLGLYKPLEHPRLRDLDSDSWVHHRILRDNYDPGEWWGAPLKHYAESMEVCQYPIGSLPPSSREASQWFRVVHNVRKFTWFEKLLSRLEATFVQINASSRRLSTLRPCKSAAQRSAQGGRQPRALAVSSAAPEPSQPRQVDDSDLKVYQAYADPRRTGHLSCEARLELMDLGQASFALAKREDRAAPAPREVVQGPELQRLLAWHVGQRAHERRRPAMQRHADKADKSERDEVRRWLRQVLEAYAPVCSIDWRADAGMLQGRRAAAGLRPEAPEALEGPASGARERLQQAAQRPERIRLCGYCFEAYRPVEPERLRTPGESAAQQDHAGHLQLCPGHRQRANELDRLRRYGSLQMPVHAEVIPRERSPLNTVGGTSERPGRSRPWGGWLQQPLAPSRPASLMHTPSKAQQRQVPRRVTLAAGGQPYPPSPALVHGISDGRAGGAGLAADKHHGRSTFPMMKSAATRRFGDVPAVAAGADVSTSSLANDGWWPQLWSYTFPHAAPGLADKSELGLPAWWLEALEEPPGAPQDTATLPPALRSRGRDVRAAPRRRNTLPPQHVKAPGLHAAQPKDPGTGQAGRSIFRGEAARQLVEGAIAGERRESASAAAAAAEGADVVR